MSAAAPTQFHFAGNLRANGQSEIEKLLQIQIFLRAYESALAGIGEGGIRTPGTFYRTPVFKTGAISRSATSPVGGGSLPGRRADSSPKFD